MGSYLNEIKIRTAEVEAEKKKFNETVVKPFKASIAQKRSILKI